MLARCNRWLVVCVLSFTAFLYGLAEGGAGEAQAPAAKTILDVTSELATKDSRDPKQQDCYYCKTFRVKLEQGVTYRIDLVSRDFDAFVRLEGPDGKAVREDNDSGGGFDARLICEATASGEYKVVASSFKPNETGQFHLTVTTAALGENVAGPLPLATGQPFTIVGKIRPTDAKDAKGRFFQAFPFEAQPGGTYRFQALGRGKFDPELTIVDPTGKVLKGEDQGDAAVSQVTFSPTEPGRCAVTVTAYRPGETGSYALTATQGPDPAAPARPVAAGGPQVEAMPPFQPVLRSELVGQLTPEDAADKDGRAVKVFTFTARPNRLYVVKLNARPMDAKVQLQDGTGKALKDEDFGAGQHSHLIVPPGPGGPLRLVVTALRPKQYGDFTLAITEREPTTPVAQPVAFERIARSEGRLTSHDSLDHEGKYYKVFVLKTRPGLTYACEMTGKGFNAYLRLVDTKGEIIRNEDAWDKAVSRLTFKADSAATLHLIATSFKPGQTGMFNLTIAEQEKDTPVSAPPPPAPPLPGAGSELKLKDGKAKIVGELTDADPSLAGKLRKFKEYTFAAEAGKTYRIDLHSDAFDAYLQLKNGAGKVLAENDDVDDHNSLDSRIVYTTPEAGTYRIMVTAFDGKTGPFVLNVATIEAGTLAVDKLPALNAAPVKAAGRLSTKDGVDGMGRYQHAYAFQAEKGRAYLFELVGSAGLDPLLRVADTQNTVIKGEDDGDGKRSLLLFMAPASETYRVMATTLKAGVGGDYTLQGSVANLKLASAELLKLDKGRVSVEGKLTKTDPTDVVDRHYVAYAVTAERGKRYAVDMRSQDDKLDPQVRVQDPAGRVVQVEDDGNDRISRLSFVPSETGIYHIVASSFKRQATGPFVLTVREVAGGAKDNKDGKKADDSEQLGKRVNQLDNATEAERKTLVKDLTDFVAARQGKLTPEDARLAESLGVQLEAIDQGLAASTYGTLGKMLAASPNAKVTAQGKVMLNAARRLNLTGQPLELKGTTLNGQSFDLAKLKGKVVLVDFWATWCGPCRQELPNIKKLYAKYHDQGFDVIGVSLDNEEKELAKFLEKDKLPWPSIYKERETLADGLGVYTIPLTILVGRDGRVVSLFARGAELDRLLEKQFPAKKE